MVCWGRKRRAGAQRTSRIWITIGGGSWNINTPYLIERFVKTCRLEDRAQQAATSGKLHQRRQNRVLRTRPESY